MGRIETTEQVFEELFHGTPVTNEGNDPEFMRILQRFIFGDISQTGTLDSKHRELVTVTVLSVLQTLPQIKAHVQAALNVSCTPVELREAIYQCAPFIGIPKTLNAISMMDEVFTANHISLPLPSQETRADSSRYEAGLAIQSPLYGSEIKDAYSWLPEPYASALPQYLTAYCFGDFYTRTKLSLKDRELLVFVMLVAMDGISHPLAAHFKGALKAGNTKEELLAALFQELPYIGFPKTMDALNCIKEELIKESGR